MTDIHFPPLVLGEPVAEISIPCGVLADDCFDDDEIEKKMIPPFKYTMEQYKNNNNKKDALVSKGSEEVVTCLVTEEPN